jgi:hypothetical protein
MPSSALWPRSQADAETLFSDNERSQALLMHVWDKLPFRCVRCGGGEYWRSARDLRICQDCACNQTLLSGTVLQSARRPAGWLLRAMWWLAMRRSPPTATALMAELDIAAYSDARRWLQRLDALAAEYNRRQKLTGSHVLGFLQLPESAYDNRKQKAPECLLSVQRIVGTGQTVREPGQLAIEPLPDAGERNEAITSLLQRYEFPKPLTAEPPLLEAFPAASCQDAAGRAAPLAAATTPDPHLQSAREHLTHWLTTDLKSRTAPQHLPTTLNRFVFCYNLKGYRYRGGVFRELISLVLMTRSM